MLELAQNIQQLHKSRESFVLVTLVSLKGSVPQIEGAKILVTQRGLALGTVGGGRIEAHAIEYAKNLLTSSGKSHLREWNLQKDIGMSCGGEVALFFDVNEAQSWHISLFGAGHVAQELCRVLSTWSCQVSVYDTRAEWLEKLPSSANIEKKLSLDMPSEVAALPPQTYFLCITQGHGFDLPILSEALKRTDDLKFIGVIGSSVKAKRLKIELKELGAKEAQLSRLVCPLGLSIGNNTPNEIAISICAQLLAVRDQSTFSVSNGYEVLNTHEGQND